MTGFLKAGASQTRTILRLAFLFLTVIAALVSAGVFGWRQVRGEVSERAQAEVDRAVATVTDHLKETDKVFAPLARSEVRALRVAAAGHGGPSLSAAPGQGTPILRFGKRVANNDFETVDAIADRMGGEATLFAASDTAFLPVSTSVKTPNGARALDRTLEAKTDAYVALRAARPYTGPVKTPGKTYFGHFEPVVDAKGVVIGAYGAQFSNETLEEIAQEITHSPVLEHGFLAVVDPRGRVLFRSANISADWIAHHAASLTNSASGEVVDGYRLSRANQANMGLRVIAGIYEPDLTAQAVRLEGASLSILGLVIVLALSLAWLLARRLTEALDEAQRSRAEAEAAKAAAEAAGAALSAELERAAHYVESLLPKRATQGPVATDWLYRPSAGVGGDAFGYHWLDETHFSFFLLDVCGHGVGAALLATTVMNVIRARTVSGADFYAPDFVLAALNAAFPMEAQNGMYFTIWYGVYDTASLTVTYAAAGHHPAVLLAPDAAPRLLQGKGLPIGCFANVNYPVFSVSTPPGSRLYVFSDGIFEVELNNTEDMFTFEEFVNIIMEWRENHTDRDIMFLLETVQQIQGRSNFDDDCALVEIEFCQARKLVLVA